MPLTEKYTLYLETELLVANQLLLLPLYVMI